MGRAHEKSSQSMLLFLMQKNQITCIKNEVMVILLIEKVIDNKMFPKSTAGLYISDSYQRNFISHRHRIFYGLKKSHIKTAKVKLSLHDFSIVSATASFLVSGNGAGCFAIAGHCGLFPCAGSAKRGNL